MRRLRPCFKTIADFRRENRAVFMSLPGELNLLLRSLDLLDVEWVAIDGSKLKASNGQRRKFSAAQRREMITHIDQRIDAMSSTELPKRPINASGSPSGVFTRSCSARSSTGQVTQSGLLRSREANAELQTC